MTKRISVSLTDATEELIRKYAERTGYKISTIIERLINEAKELRK